MGLVYGHERKVLKYSLLARGDGPLNLKEIMRLNLAGHDG
jgi:hypothetical protein